LIIEDNSPKPKSRDFSAYSFKDLNIEEVEVESTYPSVTKSKRISYEAVPLRNYTY
jgi:hypothetical protein